ncbi:MAG: DUF6850 family outer membrane beta-barrel protein [Gemmatimonadaceae bacterium]
MRALIRGLVRTVSFTVTLATTASAQDSFRSERATDPGFSHWFLAWSPLRPIAELPRVLPRAPAPPDLGGSPRPRVGLFWTAGNPASLAEGVRDTYADIRFTGASDGGTYRRPLDPDAATVRQVAGLAWRPLGPRGAAAGLVTIDEESLDDASFAGMLSPHSSNPLVVTDTTSPAMRRTRARLQGALGYRVRRWGAGVSVGYEAREHRTQDARFPRIGRVSTPAVLVGISHPIPTGRGAMIVAVTGRWVGGYETVTLIPEPGTSTVHQLEGYAEPDERVVSQPPAYYRRVNRTARAFGAGLAGTIAGVEWVLSGERTLRDEDHFSERRADPATDTWEANGYGIVSSAQRSLLRRQGLITVVAHYVSLNGAARRSDLDGDIFRASESALALTADARYTRDGSPWSFGLTFGVERETRVRNDFIAEVGTEIQTWNPGAAVAVARKLHPRITIALGASASLVSTSAAIPSPDGLGPVYQRLIAPELALYAAQKTPVAASASALYTLRSGTDIVLRNRWESLSPRVSGSGLPFSPTGDRTLWSVSAGFVLR